MIWGECRHNYTVVDKFVYERKGNFIYNIVVEFVIVCTKCGHSNTKQEHFSGDIENYKKVTQK